MTNKGKFFLLGVGMALALLGCDIVNTIVSNTVGGAKGNTVANLWSDVPPVPGGQKLSLDLPLSVQLAIQAFIKTSASSSDVNLDSFDWIAYSTSQTPQQVAGFYTNARMTAAGWNIKDQPGCAAGAGGDTSAGAGFCIFAKGKGSASEKGSVLFIALAQDDKTKQTQVYYIRLEGITISATPTKPR